MPRAGLSAGRVVDRAAELADRDGVEQLTLAGLAGDLGVRTPSLYKHVEGLPAILQDLALRGFEELAAALRSASPAGAEPRQALADLCRAYRAFAHAHPGLYAASQRAPAGEAPQLVGAAEALMELVVERMTAVSALDPGDVIHAARALRSSLHGFVALERLGGFGRPEDLDVSFARLVDDQIHALELRARAA